MSAINPGVYRDILRVREAYAFDIGCFLMRFLRTVGLACFRDWVADGRTETLEDVVAFSSALLTGSVRSVWALRQGR